MNMLASRAQLRASFLRWALFLVPLCLLLGFVSATVGPGAETAWFKSLVKPDIFPEPKWFGIVWTVLYVMIGLATAMIAAAWGARGRVAALWLFAIHFALNLAWTPVFFGLQEMTVALGVVVALIITLLLLIHRFWSIRKAAGLLLLPYLGWACFAAWLNYEFVRLNPEGGNFNAGEAVERVRIGD